MRKIKCVVMVTICFAVLSALLTSAAASESSTGTFGSTVSESAEIGEEMTLDELLIVMMGQINSLQEQVIFLQTNFVSFVDSLSTQSVDEETMEKQISQASESEKYMFRIEYYNTCSIIQNNELLKRQKTLAEKQYAVESVRIRLGLSTQSNADIIKEHLNSINCQIE